MASPVYDLSALMAELDAAGAQPDLVAAIRRANDVSSAHRDIDEALLAFRLLRRLTSSRDETPLDDADLTTIVGSLMTSAIVLYARATETKPIGRRKWFGVEKLSPDLQAVHHELMHLRNKEVAHFGKGEIIDGAPLLAEALVLRPHSASHPIGYLTSRAQNRAELVRRAENLVTTVLALSIEAVNARYTEVHTILRTLAEMGDPTLRLLRAYTLADPRLLAAEAATQRDEEPSTEARTFRGVAIVEIHDGDDDAHEKDRG
jgi:hypothetical protein